MQTFAATDQWAFTRNADRADIPGFILLPKIFNHQERSVTLDIAEDREARASIRRTIVATGVIIDRCVQQSRRFDGGYATVQTDLPGVHLDVVVDHTQPSRYINDNAIKHKEGGRNGAIAP